MNYFKNTTTLLNTNILTVISNWYRSLDQRYKIAFIVALAANIISFFLFIAHHPLNNHGMRLPWVNPSEQLMFGRWFTYVIFTFFDCADIPVILPLASIILHILSGMFTCLCWDKESSVSKLTLVTLLVSLCPVMLSAFYYTYASPNFSFALFLVALAMYLSSSFNWRRTVSASFLVMFAFATSQPSLSVVATIFMGLLLVKIFEFEGTRLDLKKMLKETIISRLIVIIVGGVFYRISLAILDISMNTHATKTIALSDFPTRFLAVAKISFNHLYFTQPELLSFLKTTLLIVVICSLLLLVTKSFVKKYLFLRIIAVLFLFCSIIVATKVMYLLSPSNAFYIYRYNFSLGYFYAFS